MLFWKRDRSDSLQKDLEARCDLLEKEISENRSRLEELLQLVGRIETSLESSAEGSPSKKLRGMPGQDVASPGSSGEGNLIEELLGMAGRAQPSLDRLGTELAGLRKIVNETKDSVDNQNMSVEDLLEAWEDRKDSEEQFHEQKKERKRQEDGFLQLFENYQDQFFSLKRLLRNQGEGWNRQLDLMDQQLEQYRKLCGIALIEGAGVPVNYSMHEVIGTVKTDSAEKEHQIADIQRCGYLYKGEVRRKAKVTAWTQMPAAYERVDGRISD